jgi:hypothetical protein
VTLDEHGNVTADYSGEIGGGCSRHVWTGRDRQYRVVSTVNALELVKWLQLDDVRALLERIHTGHSVEWDGSNYVGRLTDDALDASETFEHELEEFGHDAAVSIWRAGDFISSAHLSDLWPVGKTLESAADDLVTEALANDVFISDDMERALLGMVLRQFDPDGDDCLTDAQIAELVAFDLVTQAEADARAAAKKANAAE